MLLFDKLHWDCMMILCLTESRSKINYILADILIDS